MTRRRRMRRRVMVGGAFALVAAFVPAGPASAHATITITSPGANEQLVTAASTVTAQVTLGEHLTSSTAVDRVDLTIAQEGTSRPPIKESASPGTGGKVAVPVNLAYNGKYQVTLDALWTHTGPVIGSPSTGTGSDSLPFVVAAPPARPTDVKTTVDAAARTVGVTWKANTEPDLLFYVVQRAKGTSTDFTVVGKATEAKFADATTADAGGDYRYQVVAVRGNGLGDGKGISSDPSALSADSTAKVPDPPPPPTTAPPSTAAGATGPSSTAAGSASTGTASSVPANSPGALTTSGTVDLSGFTTVKSQTRTAPPRTVPPPDTGFQATLPFARPDSVEDTEDTAPEEGAELAELAADSPQYRELGDETSGNDRFRTMAFFAGGLLATVLLMHLLWVKSEVKRVPLEAVDPEGPLPAMALEDIDAADFAPVVVTPRKRAARPGGNRRQKVSTGA